MSYQRIAGAEPDERVVAALAGHLHAGEVVLVAARSSRFMFGLDDIQLATLLLTNQRFLVAKDKLFGKPKPTVAIDLTDLASTGFGPLYGVGPTWEVHFHTTSNHPAVIYFDQSAQAEAFKNAIFDAAAAIGVDSGERQPASHNDPVSDARLQRLHDLVDDLRSVSRRADLGEPFGEGCGLEQAMQAASSRLESVDDARRCGEIIAVDLLTNTGDSDTANEMLSIMGATPDSSGQHDLPAETRKAVENLGAAAQAFLRQFDGPGPMWELWSERDDVAVEFLCWHTVARLRLATAGRMPPVERP